MRTAKTGPDLRLSSDKKDNKTCSKTTGHLEVAAYKTVTVESQKHL